VQNIPLFPPLVGQLLQVGEESGQLQRFAARAADILESDTERSLQRMTSLIEPLLIIVLGIAIGGVALSLLQAIYGFNAIGPG
jgi:general secretion pathway protein F